MEKWKIMAANKGKNYAKVQTEFPRIRWYNRFPYRDRRHITTIIRMRTGHCLTKEHLHHIGVEPSPYCECGQIENINHIFLECPINKIPNIDMYEKFRKENALKTPFNMNEVLKNITQKTINIIMNFLNYNKIRL